MKMINILSFITVVIMDLENQIHEWFWLRRLASSG